MEFRTFRVLKGYLLLILVLTPVRSWSLGLGDITVESLLNDPLRAKIELLAVRTEELATLSTSLASVRDFDWIGIKRSKILHKLEFSKPVKIGNSFYIFVTTKDPVSESVLNFLVETQWATGRLLREYTITLEAADISPVKRNQKDPEPSYGHTAEIVQSSVNDDIPPPIPPRKTSAVSEEIDHPGEADPRLKYRSVSGDTLSIVAKKFLPKLLKDNQLNHLRMLIALLEANPHAFIDNNINGLKSNTVLLIPSAKQIEQLEKEQVITEFKRQNDRWRNRSNARTVADAKTKDEPISSHKAPEKPRQTLESEAQQEFPTTAKPKPNLTSENNSNVYEKAKSEAKLTAQDTTHDQPAAAHARLSIVSEQEQLAEEGSLTVASTEYIANLERTVTLAQELAESRRREAEEIKSRVGRLETVIERQERLIKLQNDQLSEFSDQLRKLSEPKKPTPPNYWPWIAVTVIIFSVLLILHLLHRYVVRKKTPG